MKAAQLDINFFNDCLSNEESSTPLQSSITLDLTRSLMKETRKYKKTLYFKAIQYIVYGNDINIKEHTRACQIIIIIWIILYIYILILMYI